MCDCLSNYKSTREHTREVNFLPVNAGGLPVADDEPCGRDVPCRWGGSARWTDRGGCVIKIDDPRQ